MSCNTDDPESDPASDAVRARGRDEAMLRSGLEHANMYLLSGIIGGVSILATLCLVFEVLDNPMFGDSGTSARSNARMVVVGSVAVVSAVASMWLHRRANLLPSSRPSPRVRRAEGIVGTLLGVGFVVGGFVWLRLSGGFLGLHLIAFLLGGGLLISGLRKLSRDR